MKKLSQFLRFDFDKFSEGKIYQAVSTEKWTDYDTKEILGTKVGSVIVKDNTPYKQKDGETVTNLFEKITFKVPKSIQIPANAYIMPINAVGVVYGDYRNKLSVTADDIRILQKQR